MNIFGKKLYVFKLLVLFVLISSHAFAGTDPFGGGAIYAPSGSWSFPDIHPSHPRIFLARDIDNSPKGNFPGNEDVDRNDNGTFDDDVADLVTRINTVSEITAEYNDLKNWADAHTTTSIVSYSEDAEILRNTALVALVEKEKGNNYSHYLNLTKHLINNMPDTAYKAYDVYGIATAYDWLFDDFSSSEKQSIFSDLLERGERLSNQGYMNNYPHSAALKNQVGAIVAGIAFHNDGVNDSKANEIISYYGEYIEDIWIHLMGLVGGNTGGTLSAKNYFYDGAKYRIEMLEIWKTATGKNLHYLNTHDKYYPYWDAYSMRPDNTPVKYNGNMDFSFSYQHYANYPLLASVYKDNLASYFVDETPSTYNVWRNILWYDPTISKKSYTLLPLTRHFDGVGIVLMRTGWDFENYSHSSPSNNVVAKFQSGNSYSSGKYPHFENNSFTVFYKGSLAAEDPDKNNKYTISHNTIMIADEDQENGSMYFSPLPVPEDVLAAWGENTQSDMADITRYESTSLYDYMLGDASKSYDSSKVSLFKREFVFLKSNYFVVMDRVTTTSSSYSKKYLLHSINVPKIGGITPSDGTTSYNKDLIQIDRGGTSGNGYPGLNGRLFSKALLPASRTITAVGSGQSLDLTNTKEVAKWRMEIEPSSPQLNDFFLNVMYVTDSSVGSMPSTVRISNSDGNMQSNNMVGTHIKDSSMNQVALFSSDPEGDIPSGNIVYTISPTADSEHYLFGLQVSTSYSVNVQTSGSTQTVTVSSGGGYSSSNQGSLVFAVSAGVVIVDTIPPYKPASMAVQ